MKNETSNSTRASQTPTPNSFILEEEQEDGVSSPL